MDGGESMPHMTEGAGVLDVDDYGVHPLGGDEFGDEEQQCGEGEQEGYEEEEEEEEEEEYEEEYEEGVTPAGHIDDNGARTYADSAVNDDGDDYYEQVSEGELVEEEVEEAQNGDDEHGRVQVIEDDEGEDQNVEQDEDDGGEEYVEPSLLALAIAQQDGDIITDNLINLKTPSQEEGLDPSKTIKKRVYDYLMTAKDSLMNADPPLSDKIPNPTPGTPGMEPQWENEKGGGEVREEEESGGKDFIRIDHKTRGDDTSSHRSQHDQSSHGDSATNDSRSDGDGDRDMDYYYDFLMAKGVVSRSPAESPAPPMNEKDAETIMREGRIIRSHENEREPAFDSKTSLLPPETSAVVTPLGANDDPCSSSDYFKAPPSPYSQPTARVGGHPSTSLSSINLKTSQGLPTRFSAELLYRSEEIYKNRDNSAAPSLDDPRTKRERTEGVAAAATSTLLHGTSDSPPSSGGLCPTLNYRSFPEQREAGEESLDYLNLLQSDGLAKGDEVSVQVREENKARFDFSGPRGRTIPSGEVTGEIRTEPSARISMADAIFEFNQRLGGKDGEKKLEETMDQIILKTHVNMLREATKDLKCFTLIEFAFGDLDNPIRPSKEDLFRLKNMIASELTIKQFNEVKKVSDFDSAEMYRESNEKLEMIQRNQIMANPLFANLQSSKFLVKGSGCRSPSEQCWVADGSALAADQIGEAPATVEDSRGSLHVDFERILKGGSREGEGMSRLAERVCFLNRLIEHTTSSSVSWIKLVNLLSGVALKAATVLFGDSEEDHPEQDAAASAITDPNPPSTSQWLKNRSAVSGGAAFSEDLNMGSIGIELFFGAVEELLSKHLRSVCLDIGGLAMYLNIPVVMLKWPRGFTGDPEYKRLLLDSMTSFSSRMVIPSMYVLNQINFMDEDEDNETDGVSVPDRDSPQGGPTGLELFTDAEKRRAVKRVYQDMRRGRASEKDVMHYLYGSVFPRYDGRSGEDISMAYAAGCHIINNKTPIFQNIISTVANYMEKRKHVINQAVIKLLRRAKLSLGVYCVQYNLEKASKKFKASKEGVRSPELMKNLMFRNPVPTSYYPNPYSARPPPSLGGYSASEASICFHPKGAQKKRPNIDIISNRMKRLKQWAVQSSSLSSEDECEDEETDEDETDSEAKEG